ncbi:GNAT family N-acetyltransferase [Raoultella terrigena]|uniref:GNAT family N-acetyltransferase n=1 Tax=Raoultella terrigena TaxID=577 RepID=UPI0011D1A3C7|nr:GNAT family N-acetyltransferase [Raoultella terrigena]
MDLLLEKFSATHFSDYLKLVSNSDVMAMITERAVPCDEASRDFKRLLDDNAQNSDLGYYRITDDKQGNFIGLAKLASVADQPKTAELGYMLLPEYWGLGIANQVATILIEQARRNSEISTLIAIIDPANLASKKILTNNRFITRELRDFDGLPGEILQRAV